MAEAISLYNDILAFASSRQPTGCTAKLYFRQVLIDSYTMLSDYCVTLMVSDTKVTPNTGGCFHHMFLEYPEVTQ